MVRWLEASYDELQQMTVCVCVCVCSDDYFRMKLQWKSIDADQESRFSDLRERRSLIGTSVRLSVRLSVCPFVCLSQSLKMEQSKMQDWH